LEGDVKVKIRKTKAVEIPIKEGELFLLPEAYPCRSEPANTVGLVIECKRHENENDGLLWFCEKCNYKLHETYFHLTNIEKDFIPRFRNFTEVKKCERAKTVER